MHIFYLFIQMLLFTMYVKDEYTAKKIRYENENKYQNKVAMG